MRAWQVLLVAGGIVALLGLGIVVDALRPPDTLQHAETFTIPAGAEWYYYFEIPVRDRAEVWVDFVSFSGTVEMFLYDQESFRVFEAYETHSDEALLLEHPPLASAIGEEMEDVFFVDLEAGTYYLVFAHYFGYEHLDQEVHAELRVVGYVAGISLLQVGIGAVLMAGGVALAAVGHLTRRREEAREAPAPSGVVFFEEGGPPGSTQ